MVLFRGDIKCKSLQRRTSISVILPADNIHFLQDTEEIVPKPYRTLYLLHGLYGSDDIFLANTFVVKTVFMLTILRLMPIMVNMWVRNFWTLQETFSRFHTKGKTLSLPVFRWGDMVPLGMV